MTCGKDKAPYCKDLSDQIKAKLREIEIHTDPKQGSFTEQAGYFFKYGTLEKDGLAGIMRLKDELAQLQLDYTKCRTAHGLTTNKQNFIDNVLGGLQDLLSW
jgi:hypothetical protein